MNFQVGSKTSSSDGDKISKSKVIYEFKTQDFPIQIFQGTEMFPGHLPNLDSSFTVPKDHAAFVRKKNIDISKMYQRSILEAKEAVDQMGAIYNNARRVLDPFLSDYDKEFVLPTTTAIPRWNSASTDLDQKGTIGVPHDYEVSKGTYDAIVKDYKRYVPSVMDMSMSMKRQRFIGYPFMIGGVQRDLNDLFLALSAAIISGVKRKKSNASLADVYAEMLPHHGEPFCLQGFRQQHTAKERAMVLKDGVFSSRNFNARYRIIQMADKMSVMIVRAEIKLMLATILAHPIHTQDRSEIKNRISSWMSSGKYVVANDWSSYDDHMGEKRGEQQIHIQADVIDSEAYRESSLISFRQRSFVYGHGKVWQMPGDKNLKSGTGQTTLIGCTGNYSMLVEALSIVWSEAPDSVVDKRGDVWDVLCWGDDTVLALPDKQTWDDLIDKGFPHIKMTAAPEPTIKFLGSNEAAGDFKGSFDKGYSVGRFLQQTFFPERVKEYPFNLIGYIARLDMVGDKAKDMHAAIMAGGFDLGFQERFNYQDRHAVLASLMPIVEKQAAKINQLDDALLIFTHGLDDLHDVSDNFDAIYFELLGLAPPADLDDPAKFLSSLREDNNGSKNFRDKVSKDMIAEVGKIANGDFANYANLLGRIRAEFTLQYNQGSVIY